MLPQPPHLNFSSNKLDAASYLWLLHRFLLALDQEVCIAVGGEKESNDGRRLTLAYKVRRHWLCRLTYQ